MKALFDLLRQVSSAREAGSALALFRIALSAGLLMSLGLIARADALEAIWYSRGDGGIFRLTSRHWLFAALGGFDDVSVRHVYHLTWATATLSLLGFGGRMNLLLCQQCYVALRTLNPNASGGYDTLIVLGLLVLVFARGTETLSLDCYLLRKRWTSPVQIAAWPRALLVFQLLLMYTMTGLQKVGYAWTPMGGYSALHYILQDPTWLRFDLGSLRLHRGLQLATAITWHWEQSSLLLLLHWYYRCTCAGPKWLNRFLRRWDLRKAWTAIGVSMHIGILVLLDVGPFSVVSLAYYVCLWSPSEWHRLWQRMLTYRTRFH